MRLTHLAAIAATLALATSTTAAPGDDNKIDWTRNVIPLDKLLEQENEYLAVLQAGSACKLFTEAEQRYWWKLWTLSQSIVLTHAAQYDQASARTEARKLHATRPRFEYFMRRGCDHVELTARVRDLKKRMWLAGLHYKDLTESHAETLSDLSKNTKE